MSADSRTDVLVVSVAGTFGWTNAAIELTAALRRAGAEVVAVQAPRPHDVRTFMLTDLLEASAARKVALIALAEHRPDVVVYCSSTAALLWPRPGAIWLDATAAENRPGRHGLWQRRFERRRLRAAPLVLGWSPAAADGAREQLPRPAIVVPVPVEPSGPLDEPRDVEIVTYAADPRKRRLALVLESWRAARREGETLVVTGTSAGEPEPGVRYAGALSAEEFRALLRRARAFLAAPRDEEYGIAALEALADGAQLITTPVARGAYPALEIARSLDPRLVAGPADGLGSPQDVTALAAAIRFALDAPRSDYAARAAEHLAPYRREAVSDVLRQDVLPVLLPGWRV